MRDECEADSSFPFNYGSKESTFIDIIFHINISGLLRQKSLISIEVSYLDVRAYIEITHLYRYGKRYWYFYWSSLSETPLINDRSKKRFTTACWSNHFWAISMAGCKNGLCPSRPTYGERVILFRSRNRITEWHRIITNKVDSHLHIGTPLMEGEKRTRSWRSAMQITTTAWFNRSQIHSAAAQSIDRNSFTVGP
jgi:hypothetical protein